MTLSQIRQMLHDTTAPMPKDEQKIIIYGDEAIHPSNPYYSLFKNK